MRRLGSFRTASHGGSRSSRYGFPSLSLSLWLACTLATATASAATVYKWIDEKGVVNYTTTPPDHRKAKTVDAAPAVAGTGGTPDYDEGRYWRERSQREASRDLRDERLRGETEALRQTQLRQEAASRAAETKQKTALELAITQCKTERRVDCDSAPYGNPGGTYGYPGYPVYPVVVVVRHRPATAATIPYFSVTPNFTPGFSKPLVYSNPR